MKRWGARCCRWKIWEGRNEWGAGEGNRGIELIANWGRERVYGRSGDCGLDEEMEDERNGQRVVLYEGEGGRRWRD